MAKVALLLIDIQNDFHDGGSLAVPGANADCARISEMIEKNLDKIGDVFVTLDSHHKEHIAHAGCWNSKADGSGEQPPPFTLISNADIANGKWFPVDFALSKEYCLQYTAALEKKGRFKLTIWPDHCIMGTPGNNVVPRLQVALDKWVAANPTSNKIQYVLKGKNNMTEMYSAIEAEVPHPSDPTTFKNVPFVDALTKASKVIIGGQALSHCVNYTTRDLLRYWAPRDPSDLILLLDGSSPVSGCETDAKKFIDDMRAANVTMTLTTEALATL
eukprot:CAMPEP_0181288032 /NCGR_PEP_ID=MMETSP1101-20121128/111_1 /TAXON_ID=46948 /ORGANISM="Rhodomonas abbreviata, Strain Caron Lab Isolate" /LENGTH=272 /DNA_ID=CAMNT_0023392117 /DNA_START=150 /DNA_END=968 /DNA_ORIENTATION=+